MISGYSVRNLKGLRAFAKTWPDQEIVHQLGAQIPWRHNCAAQYVRRYPVDETGN